MKDPHNLITTGAEIQSLKRRLDAAPPPPVASYGYATDSDDEDELPLRDYWRTVRKHLWLIISFAVLVTVLTAVYMARQPDFYEARLRVQVDLENNPALSSGKNGPVVVSGGADDPAYFSTQLQVLTSPALLSRVVKTLNLERDEAFLSPQGHSTWRTLLGMFGVSIKDQDEVKARVAEGPPPSSAIAPASTRGDLAEAERLSPYVGMLQGGLTVVPVKEARLANALTRLIDVRYKHRDPQVAAKVVNTLANIYVVSNLERKQQVGSVASDFLDKRIAELQAEIRSGSQRKIDYANRHQIISLKPGENEVVDRLSGLSRELLAAENDLKLAEAERDAALAKDSFDVIAESSSGPAAAAQAQLASLNQRRAQLLVENTEEWPEVKEVDKQIAVLESQLQESREKAKTNLVTNLTKRYRQAQSREQKLRDAYNQQRAKTLTQNEAAIQYNLIEQEVATKQGLLDDLLKRAGETDVVKAGLTGIPNNVYVLDYALVPGNPAGPNRTQNVMLAFALSLGLGIGLVLFRDYMDNTVRSPGEVERMLHLPVLAAIPLVRGASARRRMLPVGSALVKQNGNGSGNGNGRPLLVNEDARSPLSEAYRHLRTSVLMSTAGGAPKSILVASSQPAEGKTTTAINTALVLAQTGASVLLIDADMRHPCVHSIFNLENERGLSTYLSSEMSEAEMLSMIEQDKDSGLHVLNSGPIPPNPAELLGSEQMQRLISTLEFTFTHIVIDSPPIAYFTDSVLLSSMVDGVLLVVHSGKSSRDVVRHSRRLLQALGAKIFGVVLNGVKQDSTQEYYYADNYYYSNRQ